MGAAHGWWKRAGRVGWAGLLSFLALFSSFQPRAGKISRPPVEQRHIKQDTGLEGLKLSQTAASGRLGGRVDPAGTCRKLCLDGPLCIIFIYAMKMY
jgi:hypothetical protein